MAILKKYNKKKTIKCFNCEHKWGPEKKDKRSYLCHRCGYDQELGKFDVGALKKWERSSSKTLK